MLLKIAAFELRYQLRSPLFLVGFAIFFLLTFGSVTIDQIQIGARGNVNVNSPFALLQTTGIMSIFAVFIVTAFVANVVIPSVCLRSSWSANIGRRPSATRCCRRWTA
jgi:ABC-type transport system involved in multi-copper enzyme maturation permease subunit